MIVHQLVQYYEDNTELLPSFGCEYKEISFIVLLSKEGKFLDIQDTRGKNGEGKRMLVPQSVKRSGVAASPNCLWDNLKYVFGIGAAASQKQKKALEEKRIAFLQNLKKLSFASQKNKEVEAVIHFLESDFLKSLEKHPLWKEIVNLNTYVSFAIDSKDRLVCQESSVLEALSLLSKNESKEKTSFCLVTGKIGPIARLHPMIQGVYGAQGSGASLISYNLDSVESFGKAQGHNAPISEEAAFAYGAALNHLLNSPRKVAFNQVMTILFWAKQKTPFEAVFSDFLKLSSSDSLTTFLSKCSESEEDSLPFYVHALSPNGARLSLRFSWEGTIRDLKKRIRKHVEDLEVMNSSKDPELYSIYSLLHTFSPCHDVQYVSPRLAGEFLFSILSGLPYPQELLSSLLRRLSDEEGVSNRRVSLLKAWMNRMQDKVKIHASLDPFNQNIGYLLGRLFGVLEIAGKKFKSKKPVTVTYTLYKTASIMPKRIFPHLFNHYDMYINSLPLRDTNYFQKIKDEIVKSLILLPSNLSLMAQAEFAIGYYQQKQHIHLEIKKR
jgi:CRISPR-associated protein Csd1